MRYSTANICVFYAVVINQLIVYSTLALQISERKQVGHIENRAVGTVQCCTVLAACWNFQNPHV